MSYQPAPLTPYGAQVLDAGSYWFVDTSLRQYKAGAEAMRPAFAAGLRGLGAFWDPSRDWALAEFGVSTVRGTDEILVPEEAWGTFYRLPPGESLADVKKALYGEALSQPAGFFEWLEGEFPGILQPTIETAETVKEAGEFVSGSLVKVGVVAVLAWLASKVLLKGKS